MFFTRLLYKKLLSCVSSISKLADFCNYVLIDIQINFDTLLVSSFLCSEMFFIKVFKLLATYTLNINICKQIFNWVGESLKIGLEKLHVRLFRM